jgi:hypothetical protein
MMKNQSNQNTYNEQDLLAKDKVEVSSYLFYSKKYRKLSNDARVMYQYILKRFSVTETKHLEAMMEDTMEEFSFIDENKNLFCFVSNDELRFVLNLSEKTVTKVKQELNKVGLLFEVKQSVYKTNRLYVNKVAMDREEYKTFKNELKEFRTTESDKRKAKNNKRDMKKEVTATMFLEEENTSNLTPPIEPQNLRFNEPQNLRFMNRSIYGHSTTEDMSTTEEVISTKESLRSLKQEEEEYIYKLRNENTAYDIIYEFLNAKGLSMQNIRATLEECLLHGINLIRVQDLNEQYEIFRNKNF